MKILKIYLNFLGGGGFGIDPNQIFQMFFGGLIKYFNFKRIFLIWINYLGGGGGGGGGGFSFNMGGGMDEDYGGFPGGFKRGGRKF